MIEVRFLVKASGRTVTKTFMYEEDALRFKNKLLRSKKCTFISYLVYPF